jgi:hypothetical protein
VCTVFVDASGNHWDRQLNGSTLSVLECGALPDNGTTDNAIPFQAGINALLAKFGGGTLYLPASFNRTTSPQTPNCYVTKSQVNLPPYSSSSTGSAWDESNPFRVIGDGPVQICWQFSPTGSDKFALAQETIGGATHRQQNAGLEIANISFIGPESISNTACAIGVDNTTAPYIHDNWFQGWVGDPGSSGNNVGGCAIEIYGYQVGGSLGANIMRNRFGFQKFTNGTGPYPYYVLGDMYNSSVRYAIWLNGPYNTNGGVNDVNIAFNRFESYLIGGVRISGSGTWSPGSFGSSQDVSSLENKYFTYVSHSMERNSLSGATSSSTMTLNTLTGSYQYSGSGLTGLVVRVQQNNGVWSGAGYIQSPGGTGSPARTVTISPVLPFTPIYASGSAQSGTSSTITLAAGSSTVSGYYNNAILTIGVPGSMSTCSTNASGPITNYNGTTLVATVSLGCAPTTDTYTIASFYELGYADVAARTEWPTYPFAIGHAIYWAQDYNFHSAFDYFENTVMLVASGSQNNCVLATPPAICQPTNAGSVVDFIAPENEVTRNHSTIYEDGSFFMPSNLKSATPNASGQVSTADVSAGLVLADPRLFANAAPLMYLCKNNTGHTLSVGDVVSIDANGGGPALNNCVDPATYTTATYGQYPCFIVTGPSAAVVTSFPNGQPVSIAGPGSQIPVSVNPNGSPIHAGALLLGQSPADSGLTSGTLTAIDPGSASAQQVAQACAVAVGTTTGTAAAGTLLRAVAQR